MKKKIKVALLFGGKSAEHEVSLRSAKNVADAIDKDKYDVVFIGLDKKGRWLMNESSKDLLNTQNPKLFKLNTEGSQAVALIPESNGQLSNLSNDSASQAIDVVFPILHGPFGEDGTVQGLLKLANIPFVGAGILGSAVGMDKDVMKRLLKGAGIPITKFVTVHENEKVSFTKLKKELGLLMYIKPANMGSSVGVSKVTNEKEFKQAIKNAFDYDRKILIEAAVKGREVECSVLGNDKPIASVVGEIVVKDQFYSYEAKYIDENGAVLEIPAKISKKDQKRIQEIAIKTFKVLCCEGFARVDMFLKKNGQVLVNEINTIPGFTSISMYPKLWEASGISYTDLIDKLIQLAMERFEKEQRLKTNYLK